MKIKLFKFLEKNHTSEYGKKFFSFGAAKTHSDKISTYFDKRFTAFEGPNKVELSDRFYVASILATLVNKKKPNILDIGGGPNPIYSYIKKSTNITTKCFVLDTSKLVKIIKNKIPKKFKTDIKYIVSLNEIKLKYLDIVYFNSSLQYLENYELIIKKVSKYKPRYILVSYTPLHFENKNYYSVQYGIPGSTHPIIFFSVKKLKKLLSVYNYKSIYENKYINNNQKYTSLGSSNFFYGDILFRKRGN